MKRTIIVLLAALLVLTAVSAALADDKPLFIAINISTLPKFRGDFGQPPRVGGGGAAKNQHPQRIPRRGRVPGAEGPHSVLPFLRSLADAGHRLHGVCLAQLLDLRRHLVGVHRGLAHHADPVARPWRRRVDLAGYALDLGMVPVA